MQKLVRLPSALRCLAVLFFLTAGGGSGCTSDPPRPGFGGPDSSHSAGALGVAQGGTSPAAEARWLAETTRNPGDITQQDLKERDLALRRSAARLLARAATDRSRELLVQSLADEDPEVLAWSAFGLGRTCSSEHSYVPHLVARGASWAVTKAPPTALDPEFSLVDALARCGSREVEISLRAQLNGPARQGEMAARGLGKLAFRRQHLDDAAWVALLDAATRTEQALPGALFAFGELASQSTPIQERLLTTAEANLAQSGLPRELAVRALSRARAVGLLGKILVDPRFSTSERLEAAKGLARAQAPGQQALVEALPQLAPADRDPPLSGADFPVLRGVLELLISPVPKAVHGLLGRLTGLKLEGEAASANRQRGVILRCAAAVALVGAGPRRQELRDCDPDPQGRTGALSLLAVMDRGKITGANRERWRNLLGSSDPVVTESALRLLAHHSGIEGATQALADALRSKRVGPITVAAQLLANHPDLAQAGTEAGAGPPADLVQALSEAIKAPSSQEALEAMSALLDAVGALGLLSLKPDVEAACSSSSARLRTHAERAIHHLGDRARRCPSGGAAISGRPAATQAPAAPTLPLRLVLHTTAGVHEITIEPNWAPRATAQIVELARRGFYNGLRITRWVPGFLVQFGDPDGDGFGTRRDQTLATESAPVPFEKLSVGIAESGPDSGATQLFVTLGDYPHLDGEFTRIGRASPGFELLTLGDVIEKVEVQN